MLVKRIAVSPHVESLRNSMLERSIPLRFPYFDYQIASYVLSKGTLCNISESISVRPLLSRMEVVFSENDAFFGKSVFGQKTELGRVQFTCKWQTNNFQKYGLWL